jgi:hypothetical protein
MIEETWWEAQTTTGLTVRVPAPLRTTGGGCEDPGLLLERAKDYLGHPYRRTVQSHSRITGMTYALDLGDILLIQVFVRKEDPERLIKAQMKAAGLSPTSSTSGPAATLPSGVPANPSGPFTGARIRRDTH